MSASAEKWPQSSKTTGGTAAVQQQVAAMGSGLFEIGLYDPRAGGGVSVMIPRVWDIGTIVKSVQWLHLQNCKGRNIYVRPNGEHDLSMVDDLTADAVSAMKEAGTRPKQADHFGVTVRASRGSAGDVEQGGPELNLRGLETHLPAPQSSRGTRLQFQISAHRFCML